MAPCIIFVFVKFPTGIFHFLHGIGKFHIVIAQFSGLATIIVAADPPYSTVTF
jgi:hypothetical protein